MPYDVVFSYSRDGDGVGDAVSEVRDPRVYDDGRLFVSVAGAALVGRRSNPARLLGLAQRRPADKDLCVQTTQCTSRGNKGETFAPGHQHGHVVVVRVSLEGRVHLVLEAAEGCQGSSQVPVHTKIYLEKNEGKRTMAFETKSQFLIPHSSIQNTVVR